MMVFTNEMVKLKTIVEILDEINNQRNVRVQHAAAKNQQRTSLVLIKL